MLFAHSQRAHYVLMKAVPVLFLGHWFLRFYWLSVNLENHKKMHFWCSQCCFMMVIFLVVYTFSFPASGVLVASSFG